MFSWYQSKLELGFRYDKLSQQNSAKHKVDDEHINASVKLSRAVSQTAQLQLDIANGFRYPSLSERYYSGTTPRGQILANENLKAETSLGAQLAINWALADTWQFDTSIYHYTLDDYIERYRLNEQTLSYRNLAKAKIKGIEVALRWQPSALIEHHFSYQHQTGEDRDNNTLADLHPNALKWQSLLSMKQINISHSLSYRFKQDDVASSEQARDSALIWDMSLSYQLNQQQSISLIVNNLTNEHYYASADDKASFEPKRNVTLKTEYIF
ncbi:TonB-dependent receptor [Catenovulum sp. SM1970]|uniref:TonB-dependent receptor domain-containing protein n=1 Tax=Marinifaba aquimaris TaxID=2741323 RepID=UPI001571781F|nr:TonB-dependent receptor [Marinifaba aquimaris]